MDKITVLRIDRDGLTTLSDISWRNIVLQTPNMFPLLRGQRPNELDLLMREKARYNFEHVDGCVIKLVNAPNLLYPHVDEINTQKTLDREPQDIFSKYKRTNFIIPDPSTEYLYQFKEKYDNKILDAFGDVERIKDYITVYRTNKEVMTDKSFKEIRKKLHDNFWLRNNRSDQQEMSVMLRQIMNKEFKYFGYGVPFTPVITDMDYMNRSIQINESCQAIAYSQDMECASMFVISKRALKDDDIMGEYYDYVRKNTWATLNIVKFIGLDLHQLDLRARRKYFEFMSEIAEIKERNDKKIFMLLEGGNQGYLSNQVFDIVSHSLTGFDMDIDYGESSFGYWWDETLQIPRPAEESFPLVNRNHCDVCSSITQDDFFNYIINEKRRIHRLHDLNQKATDIFNAIQSKNLGLHMRRVLANSEFSSFQEYLLNP